jgi:hypothetical protein
MSNDYDPNYDDETADSDLLPYDDQFDDDDYISELMAEGYSEYEARRMAGDYSDDDEDEYGYGDDDLDRDIPDFFDGGDFE